MSAEYDVDGRLAEGRSAVADFTEYVQACQQLGHQYPDLAGLAERYATEEGLDLRVLAGDADALAAVAAVADDAVRQQAHLVTALSGAWAGQGAAAALDFMRRHHQAATTVAAAVHEAAGTLVALRDELWRAIDAKVGATLDVDERSVGRRAAWLAAARVVATGSGDRSVASELIDQQVEPFVANDIRADWLDSVRTGTASAAAAYDAAVARLRAGSQAVFEVPGALGPQWVAPVERGAPARDPLPPPVGASAGVAPAAFAVPAAAHVQSPAPAAPPAPPAPPVPAAPLVPPAPPLPESLQAPTIPPSAAAPLGDVGGGAPGVGGMGLSGFGQQLSDLIGGLVGATADATPELPELDRPDLGDAGELDDTGDETPEDDEAAKEPDDENGEETEPADSTVESGPESQAEHDVAPEPPPPPPAPTEVPAEPVPPVPPVGVEALPESESPCEIAADELPQVGG